jgi:hypothetical protein
VAATRWHPFAVVNEKRELAMVLRVLGVIIAPDADESITLKNAGVLNGLRTSPFPTVLQMLVWRLFSCILPLFLQLCD